MAVYLVKDKETGEVVNRIVWDGLSPLGEYGAMYDLELDPEQPPVE